MKLIMFNTLMGVAAGLALLLVPRAWAQLRGERMPFLLVGRRRVDPAGWAAALGVLGGVLTALGLVMTIWHPLAAAKDYIDTIFGEPCLLLGLILLAAAWYLARQRGEQELDEERLRSALAPVSWVVFGLGLVLLACALAIARFNAVGAAPAQEPITGLLHAYPMVENLFFAVLLYGLAATGCLLFPAVVAGQHRAAWLAVYWSWTISGVLFTVFSAMNYYTHTGMLINIGTDGPDLRW